MLIRFICENFKSFREKAVFSMIASKITRHPTHVVPKNKKNILRGAYVFGANAAGKTNFVKAIDFVRRIVLDGLERVDCRKQGFLLSSKGKENHIGSFQFDILVKDRFFSYGFAVNYLSAEIDAEWLFENGTNGKEKCYFSRIRNDDGETTIESEFNFSEEERKRFDVYKSDYASLGMRKTLFLSDMAKRGTNVSDFSNALVEVFLWFHGLLVIFPESHFTGIPSFSVDDHSRQVFSEWLRHFDTGIDSLVSTNIPEDKFWDSLPIEIREHFRSNILSDLSSNRSLAVVSINANGTNYYISRNNDEIQIRKVLSNHGRDDILFDFKDESDGTRRLFDLLPLLQIQKTGKVIVIDELDRSLHTKVTIEFLRLFYELSTGSNSPIIVTTHDDDILDLDLIRQDEIWFVERSDNNSSHLYSLSKFKARFDNDIRKGYLLGRYGALPIFKKIVSLNKLQSGGSEDD